MSYRSGRYEDVPCLLACLGRSYPDEAVRSFIVRLCYLPYPAHDLDRSVVIVNVTPVGVSSLSSMVMSYL